jgi:hypothetical protein
MRYWLGAIAVFFLVLIGVGFLMPVAPVDPEPAPGPVPAGVALPLPEPLSAGVAVADTKPSEAVIMAAPMPNGPNEIEAEFEPLDTDAVASLRESFLHGDDRAPPIGRNRQPEERPTAEELDSPDSYLSYESRQDRKIKAAFVRAADEQIPYLQQAIEEARVRGLDPQQLAEGEEKLRRLQVMRAELLESDPGLINAGGSEKLFGP